ncbi:MAG: hypothetical protein K1X57_12740 [Gemmataceae bacterium]|nr:hypothetical protein [Gemmataceae bacterium]
MEWYWYAGGFAFGALLLLIARAMRGAGRAFRIEQARESFRLQRELLEARFLDAAASTGKPKGLEWKDVELDPFIELVRDRASGELLGLSAATIKFAAIAGGPMEGIEAVDNLRYASAVFIFRKSHWHTDGRALFNMHPEEAIRHFVGQFERLT